MTDSIHIYIDKEKIIQEIELSDTKTFNQYKHIIIPNNKTDEFYELYQKREQHPSVKNNKFLLVEIDGTYHIKKAVYIYYHFKNKNIHSITPRKQETLDSDKELRHGLVAVGELLEECINGTKSMINCRANTDGDVLIFEEIPIIKIEYDVSKNVVLITDCEIEKTNKYAVINIVYDGNKLIIKNIDDSVLDKEFELFFMNRFNSTIFYGSVFFMFTEVQEEINIPLTLEDNYMVISEYKNIMTFISSPIQTPLALAGG